MNDRAPSHRANSRFETAAAVGAAIMVAPAVVFLAAAVGRLLQPPNREPAHLAGVIFDWFAALPQAVLAVTLLAGPALALMLGALALSRCLAGDQSLRGDIRELGQVGLRILRRPAAWLSALVVLASACILLLLGWHAIVG